MRMLIQGLNVCGLILMVLICYALTWIPKIGQARVIHYFLQLFAKLILRTLKLEITTEVNTRSMPSQYILIANHTSLIDSILLFVCFPRIYFVRDVEHETIPLFGRMINCINHISFDRKSHHSRTRCMKTLMDHLDSGDSLIIFPQGETSDKIEKFYLGAFSAAVKKSMPILLVYIEYQSLKNFYFSPPWHVFESIKKMMAADDKRVSIRIIDTLIPKAQSDAKLLRNQALSQYQALHQHPVREVSINPSLGDNPL